LSNLGAIFEIGGRFPFVVTTDNLFLRSGGRGVLFEDIIGEGSGNLLKYWYESGCDSFWWDLQLIPSEVSLSDVIC
jgi:hypothetical protein